jgi:hypothetical protein
MSSEMAGYTSLPEPDLLFAGNKTHKHPLQGGSAILSIEVEALDGDH